MNHVCQMNLLCLFCKEFSCLQCKVDHLFHENYCIHKQLFQLKLQKFYQQQEELSKVQLFKFVCEMEKSIRTVKEQFLQSWPEITYLEQVKKCYEDGQDMKQVMQNLDYCLNTQSLKFTKQNSTNDDCDFQDLAKELSVILQQFFNKMKSISDQNNQPNIQLTQKVQFQANQEPTTQTQLKNKKNTATNTSEVNGVVNPAVKATLQPPNQQHAEPSLINNGQNSSGTEAPAQVHQSKNPQETGNTVKISDTVEIFGADSKKPIIKSILKNVQVKPQQVQIPQPQQQPLTSSKSKQINKKQSIDGKFCYPLETRLEIVKDAYLTDNLKITCKKYNISRDTLWRYKKQFNQHQEVIDILQNINNQKSAASHEQAQSSASNKQKLQISSKSSKKKTMIQLVNIKNQYMQPYQIIIIGILTQIKYFFIIY